MFSSDKEHDNQGNNAYSSQASYNATYNSRQRGIICFQSWKVNTNNNILL